MLNIDETFISHATAANSQPVCVLDMPYRIFGIPSRDYTVIYHNIILLDIDTSCVALLRDTKRRSDLMYSGS